MADYLDTLLGNNVINPIGSSYTDGNNDFRTPVPSSTVKDFMSDLIDTYTKRDEGIGWELNVLGDDDKYAQFGMSRNKQTLDAFNKGTLEKQFAELQSGKSKLWNGVKQAAWGETVLGTLGSLGTLYDIVSGNIFKANNDYQNPWTEYFENLQNEYREANKIYVDPDNTHDPSEAGWWASNMPSIMSSITLLLPSTGMTKGLGLLTKATKADKFARNAVKAITRANKYKTAEDAAQGLNAFQRWANSASTINATNRGIELGLTAAFSRTLENYQESRQVYNDMYDNALSAFTEMSDEEFANYLDKHDSIKKHFANSENQLPRRDDVAKYIAKQSADETFVDDYTNIVFDVAQLYALRNPLKLMRNMRTNTAVSKAQRLARRYPNKTAAEIAKLESERKFGKKVLDYASDRYKNAAIIASELSEGVEEGVNYIAQQEGMHLGNLLLDKDNYSTFNDRLVKSYFDAPELYESAFWGVLGGVVFQSLGSGFNRLQQGIGKQIEKATNKEDAKTKEKTNKEAWQDDFENPETKRRVTDIEKRGEDLRNLENKLAQIKDGKDPYHTADDGVTAKTFTSDIEQTAAINRAVDEYITSMTLRAMDNGNYDLLKAYFQDENVKKALVEAGIAEEGDEDAIGADMIAKMDDIERRYNDNLIALDNVSAAMKESVPIEYLQIIARDNVAAQLDIDNIQKRIDGYEVSASNNERRYNISAEDAMNFKAASALVVSARRLALLNAEKREIEANTEQRESLAGQIRLDQIEKEKEAINEYIYNSGDTYSDSLTKLLWATGVGLQGAYDETGRFTLSKTDEYLDFLDKIAKRERKYSPDAKHSFELSDERILSLFGEDGASGTYGVLAQDLDRDFDILNNLDKEAKALDDDYQIIAALNINKYIQQSKISTKASEVRARINELHNVMNAARVKAISDSHKAIYDTAKKYGYEEVRNYIFNNVPLNIENAEELQRTKKILDDAIEVLNLTSASNQQLAEDLNNTLILGSIRAAADNAGSATSEELNPVNENPSETEQNEQTGETSSQPSETLTSESSAEIRPSEETNQPQEEPNQRRITANMDGGINVEDIANDEADDTSFEYVVNEDGSYTLLADKKSSIAPKLLESGELFDGYDRNNTNPMRVTKNPVLYSDSGETIVTEKGIIEYNTPTEEQPAEAPSTISSTGGLTGFEANETPANATPVAAAEEDEELTLYTRLQSEAIPMFRNRDKARPVAEVLEEIRQQLINNHNAEADQVSVGNEINRVIESIKKRAERQGLLGSVNKVIEEMSSSVTEMPNGHYDFGAEYKKAVKQLMEDYAKRVNLPEINGKYYINLENLLRNINELYDDKSMASLLYNTMKEYLKTSEAKETYVVTDNNVDDPNFLNNVRKSFAERAKERIGNRDRYRVSIDKFFENPTKEFLDAFNSIERGDKLETAVENNVIVLKKNGVVIGVLPSPKVDPNTGNLYMWTKGWKTDVGATPTSGDYVSNLSSLFFDILQNRQDINNIIYELNYGNLNEEDTKKKINEVYALLKDAIQEYNKANNTSEEFINDKATRREVVEYIQSLWKYFATDALDPDTRRERIEESLDMWFEKILDSYSTMYNIINNSNPNNINIEVANITSGVVIRIQDILPNSQDKVKIDRNAQYEAFNYATDGIADLDNTDIAVVSSNKTGELIVNSGNKPAVTVEHRESGNRGTIYAVIKNKSGINDYVIGTSVKVGDTKVKGTAAEIIKTVKAEINARVDAYLDNPSIENAKQLTDFLTTIFYSSANSKANSNLPTNTGLFYGVRTAYNATYGISFGIDGLGIQINGASSNFGYNDKVGGTFRQLSIKNNKKVFKDALETIINNAAFNISITSMNNNHTNGFGTVLASGKYEVRISRLNQADAVFTFDSFKDYVLKGDIIKVNTAIDPVTHTNYNRKTDNQAGNQVLEVSIDAGSITSSPVEDMDNVERKLTPVEQVLNDSTIEDKANKLAEMVFSKDTLNTLNKLGLLPKNVIFAEDLNEENADKTWRGDNARANLRTGETLVGRRFIDMFNETGEFITDPAHKGANRMQAIRKLIHEQLHHRLNRNKKYRQETLTKIEEIYEDFKNYLDANNVEADAKIRQYLFTSEPRDVALEEFLVESLTSKELADYLNNIEIESKDVKIKRTLWQKFLKTLSDIFGWGVKEGSLYEKELKSLQNEIQQVETGVKQLEFNFENTTTAPAVTEETPSTTPSVDDITLDDLDDIDISSGGFDTRGSSITEDGVKHTSVYALINGVSEELQVKFNEMLDRGEVSISCR